MINAYVCQLLEQLANIAKNAIQKLHIAWNAIKYKLAMNAQIKDYSMKILAFARMI